MQRIEIIRIIGETYQTANMENGEFNYPKALNEQGKSINEALITSRTGKKRKFLDIRFVKNDISILVETKNNFDQWKTQDIYNQLQSYIHYEKVLTGNKIVAILANTQDERLKVWWGGDLTIDESHRLKNHYSLKSFNEYADLFTTVQNDKEQVITNTYVLNKLLHKHGVNEKNRSQFVGMCLLALKNGIHFEGLTSKQILSGIEEILESLLEKNLSKAEKLLILKNKILSSQDIRDLKQENLQEILRNIQSNIWPYINEKSTKGQDILNLFFTTFNKYVGKADKNQAFTPDHIVQFMCQIVEISRHSKILDPCCGSGAFLVRAMTEAIDDCSNLAEQEQVKKNNIFGIELEETAFGLATTNMLIHGDGNSNIIQGSCFEKLNSVNNVGIDVVLMNPPYNAQRKHSNEKFSATWDKNSKQDPSKGFHYVYYVASTIKKGRLAVLLPMQCAIGGKKNRFIQYFKEMMLRDHTLDAVFSLPHEVFHPSASPNVCCMIFTLGQRHCNSPYNTFFGYFRDDGFVKRKNMGRVEKVKENSTEGVWTDIQSRWIDLYRERKSVPGLSVTKKVTELDEWLAEAYMETDYSTLDKKDFEETIREFVSYKILTGQASSGEIGVSFSGNTYEKITTKNWRKFKVNALFNLENCKCSNASNLLEKGDDIFYIGAKKTNNGVMEKVKKNEKLTSKGNCLIFICDGQGSIGYSNYIDSDFIGSTTLTAGYNDKLNKYSGLFLVTLFDLERPKYSFGRKYRNFLHRTEVKLPINSQGNPDWKYMEDYIKSLPFSGNL